MMRIGILGLFFKLFRRTRTTFFNALGRLDSLDIGYSTFSVDTWCKMSMVRVREMTKRVATGQEQGFQFKSQIDFALSPEPAQRLESEATPQKFYS